MPSNQTVKWRIYIPKPRAERMAKESRTVIINISDGWEENRRLTFELPPELSTFDFELDADIEPIYNTSVIDGLTFDVSIEFKNACGSRHEKFSLVPENLSKNLLKE